MDAQTSVEFEDSTSNVKLYVEEVETATNILLIERLSADLHQALRTASQTLH